MDISDLVKLYSENPELFFNNLQSNEIIQDIDFMVTLLVKHLFKTIKPEDYDRLIKLNPDIVKYTWRDVLKYSEKPDKMLRVIYNNYLKDVGLYLKFILKNDLPAETIINNLDILDESVVQEFLTLEPIGNEFLYKVASAMDKVSPYILAELSRYLTFDEFLSLAEFTDLNVPDNLLNEIVYHVRKDLRILYYLSEIRGIDICKYYFDHHEGIHYRNYYKNLLRMYGFNC